MKAQDIVEQILFRRALEHRLEGYTLDTAIEICEAKVADTRFTQDRRSMRGSHE